MTVDVTVDVTVDACSSAKSNEPGFQNITFGVEAEVSDECLFQLPALDDLFRISLSEATDGFHVALTGSGTTHQNNF